MPISLQELVDEIIPERTVLIFGAGASIPSGAPSVAKLIEVISKDFHIDPEGLTLAEISGLAERKRNRRDLIESVRSTFKGLRPKGSILNLPLYEWKSLYTTNYDELVEESYEKSSKPLTVFSSNFDFTIHGQPNATKLFKIHGTLTKDVADGNASRIILTDVDYDQTQEFREALYIRLAADLTAGTNVIVIGQSLADPDLRDIVQKAISINQKAMGGGRIALLLYTPDANRASLFEARGLRVAFGGLDDLFVKLEKKGPQRGLSFDESNDSLDLSAALRPTTIVVEDEVDPNRSEVSALFNGWPAKYPDIVSGLTFDRSIATEISSFLQRADSVCAIVLGASGVGKTTASRQVLLKLRGAGILAWEHKGDHPIGVESWIEMAHRLRLKNRTGILMIDEAHAHLFEINALIDRLASDRSLPLKILLVSTRNHWGPRVKTPSIYSYGKEFGLSQLSSPEIDRLLTLVETSPAMRSLVESGFGGFSRHEQRRRLVDRCEADMFVCLKNIFASEKFDDIILREYAGLEGAAQDVYRNVAAMEYSGVKVHRQLVMRLLGMSANNVSATLENLAEIISEYEINGKEGIYGWRVRHSVIAAIIAKYKFSAAEKILDLFEKVISQISPTYDIEIRTIIELCNAETGISKIPDKHQQNKLLRKMMSIAPGERVPRHRLIRNLIELGEFEKAESEIRIFEKDFRRDGPVVRYRILLLIARATQAPDILKEDREVILEQARELAVSAINTYQNNKTVLSAYCELGVETFKITGSHEVYDAALDCLKRAESRLGDPDITKIIGRFQRRISMFPHGSAMAK